jgi:hypothetical protein
VAALAHNDIQQIAGAIGGTQSARLIERSQASVRVVGSVCQGPLPGLVSSVPFVACQASGRMVRVLGDAGLAAAVGLIGSLSALVA